MEMANEQAGKMEKDSYEETNTVKNRNKQMSNRECLKIKSMVYRHGQNQLTVKRMFNVGTVEAVFP